MTGCGPPTEARARELPNVVVVVIDTLRADRLPFYGNPRDTAPTLDALAARNVVFERAWSTSSWTAPATASLFTSVYPSQHQVTMGFYVYEALKAGESPTIELRPIPTELETLPSFFSKVGYRTFGIADNPNLQERVGFARGFDRFRVFSYESGERVNAQLAEWRDEIAAGPPFFVYLHYMDPHHPYHQREPWYVEPQDPSPRAAALAAYESEIRYTDERVGEAFEMLGVDENFVVVVTSDHGEELMQRGEMHHEFRLYNELIRVPLVLQHPGATLRRQRVTADVSLLDVLPTLRHILDLGASLQDEGQSLVPTYTGDDPLEPRALFAMRSLEIPSRDLRVDLHAVLQGEEKLIFTQGRGRIVHELYDLGADPGETANRVDDDPQTVEALQALWKDFEEHAPRWSEAASSITLSAEEAQELEKLGYARARD